MRNMKLIRLDYADIKYGPPKRLVKALCKDLENINLYPREIYIKLKKELAKYCGVKPENIVMTNGSDEAIDLVTATFRKTVLIPTPTFVEYESAARRNRCNIITKNCFKRNTYKIDYSKNDLKRANLVWICNPNNPTGTLIPKETIVKILKNTNALVAIDECYYEFSKKTVIDLINKYKNLIVIRSFSKGFGLAGLRLGYIIANRKVIRKIERNRPLFNVNRISAMAGYLALKEKKYYKSVVKNIIAERNRLTKFLTKKGLKVFESDTNFILIKFNNIKTAKTIYKKLKNKKVYTFPSWISEFTGFKGPFIRITIGTEKEMKVLVKYLNEILNRVKV